MPATSMHDRPARARHSARARASSAGAALRSCEGARRQAARRSRTAAETMCSAVMPGACSSAAMRALAHHQHAVGEMRQFLGVAGIEQDRRVPPRRAAASVRRFHAWSRHRRRASRRRTAGCGDRPAASGRAAPSAGCRRRARRPARRCRRCAPCSCADHVLARSAAPARAQHAEPARCAAGSPASGCRARSSRSSRPSVLRSSGTRASRCRRGSRRAGVRIAHRPSVDRDAPAARALGAEQHEEQLAMAVAGETADAEHLAPMQREARRPARAGRSAPRPPAPARRPAAAARGG